MSIPVGWSEVFGRARACLSHQGKTLAARPGEFEVYEAELRPGAKVVKHDLEKLAKSLGVMAEFETPSGEWAASKE